MPRKTLTLLLALAVLFVLAVLAVVGLTMGRTPPRPPLPNPNGYDDFVKAGEAVPESVEDFQTLDQASLRDLVSTNAESLRLLRVGLTRQCVMPMNLALPNAAGLMTMKLLAQLLAAEGRLREIDSRPADAARSYTDAIRFGNEMSRGGVLITRLVGIACESIGCRALANIVPKLGREDARIVLAELERVDAGRVTWAEVRQNELYSVIGAIAWWEGRQMVESAETRHKTVAAHERLLAAELALRCYQAEQGHPPARLDDLVTNYLSGVPQDPFTGQALIYRPQSTNWLLYSVGPDGVDDGGKSVGPSVRGTVSRGDLFYDSPY
jgi:hypothetical protein